MTRSQMLHRLPKSHAASVVATPAVTGEHDRLLALPSRTEKAVVVGMAKYVESVRRAPRALTERKQKALLRVTGELRAGWRNHVLFAMALGTTPQRECAMRSPRSD